VLLIVVYFKCYFNVVYSGERISTLFLHLLYYASKVLSLFLQHLLVEIRFLIMEVCCLLVYSNSVGFLGIGYCPQV